MVFRTVLNARTPPSPCILLEYAVSILNTVLLNGLDVKHLSAVSGVPAASFRSICLEKQEIFFCGKRAMLH
jgi:hypothetical protein